MKQIDGGITTHLLLPTRQRLCLKTATMPRIGMERFDVY